MVDVILILLCTAVREGGTANEPLKGDLGSLKREAYIVEGARPIKEGHSIRLLLLYNNYQSALSPCEWSNSRSSKFDFLESAK